jgi:hypothetical protein
MSEGESGSGAVIDPNGPPPPHTGLIAKQSIVRQEIDGAALESVLEWLIAQQVPHSLPS